jgi:hypothetical protein
MIAPKRLVRQWPKICAGRDILANRRLSGDNRRVFDRFDTVDPK